MIIPDMLKNAPMFKRLDAKIKVQYFPPSLFVLKMSQTLFSHVLKFVAWDSEALYHGRTMGTFVGLLINITVFNVQGKGSSGVGVGRGRASTMQAKVSVPSSTYVHITVRCSELVLVPSTG